MEIAFILSYPRIVPTDGIVSQAYAWKNGLEQLGHTVTLINMWETQNWTKYNAIVFFGFSEYMRETVNVLSKINPNLILAPIFDPNYSKLTLSTYAHWGNDFLRLSNHYHALYKAKGLFKRFLVRSEFEKVYLSDVFNIKKELCKIVPLAYQVSPTLQNSQREDFCLHISLLCDQRKNVKRLIDASIKYNFQLKLCGVLRNTEEEQLLSSWISDHSNIEYLGYVTKEKMIELYSKAKVFALPSIYEGVGIVALDAAAMGCDIVITKLGGPKEYYHGKAIEVDPYNTDEIGIAVKELIDGKTFQPELSELIHEKYSTATLSELLSQTINNAIHEN